MVLAVNNENLRVVKFASKLRRMESKVSEESHRRKQRSCSSEYRVNRVKYIDAGKQARYVEPKTLHLGPLSQVHGVNRDRKTFFDRGPTGPCLSTSGAKVR